MGLFCRLRDSVHGIRAVSDSEGKEQARVCVCVCVCHGRGNERVSLLCLPPATLFDSALCGGMSSLLLTSVYYRPDSSRRLLSSLPLRAHPPAIRPLLPPAVFTLSLELLQPPALILPLSLSLSLWLIKEVLQLMAERDKLKKEKRLPEYKKLGGKNQARKVKKRKEDYFQKLNERDTNIL